MGEKFEVYLDQQYIGQTDGITFDVAPASETETGEFSTSEELSFKATVSMLTSSEELWELIQRAREAEEEAARKLEEWTDELNRAFAAWNEMAGLVLGAIKKKPVLRYKPGVSVKECQTEVSTGRWIVDRLAQENKPPG